MAGTFPTTIAPRAFNFSSNRPNSTVYTLSGKRSTKQFAGQYFGFTVTMPLMTQAQFQEYHAFLVKQKGSFDTFDIEYPLDNQGADKGRTIVATRAVHSTGATAIQVDGLSNNQDDALKAGDLISFTAHDKVYMVTADVNSNGTGQSTINIEPPLQADLILNEGVTVNKPTFKVALVQDDILYQTDASGLFTLSFEVREIL